MFVLMDGQRLPFDQACADTVGALAGLAPVGTQPQPGTLEHPPFGGRGHTIEDHPAGIGQQHRVPCAGQLLVQAVHLVAGNLQHLLQALAALQHAAMLKHGRRHALGRVQVVILQTAQP
ncbi:hypothetical protein D3C75_777830 [compost metagenome]